MARDISLSSHSSEVLAITTGSAHLAMHGAAMPSTISLAGQGAEPGVARVMINWARVSDPHTCDFNAAWLSHVLSKIAINISIFHLGSRTPLAHPGLGRPANVVDSSTMVRGQVRPTSGDRLHPKLRRSVRTG